MRRRLSLAVILTAFLFAACDTGGAPEGGADVSVATDAAVIADVQADIIAADIAREDAAPEDVAADVALEDASAEDIAADVASEDVAPDVQLPPQLCEGELAPLTHETSADATFRHGPFVQSVFEQSAVIVWMDIDPTEQGCVTFSQPGSEERSACVQADERGQFEVTLDDLTPDEPVTYRVTEGDKETESFTFHLAPSESRPFRMTVFADVHANTEVMSTIGEEALTDGTEVAVAVGDLVSQPVPEQWDAFFDGIRALGHRVPIWPVIGNHEARHPSYFENFVVPGAAEPPVQPGSWYSVRWGSVWMGMLELPDFILSAVLDSDSPEVAWLREQLASDEAQSARWRLLFVHQPPRCAGWGHCDGYHGEPALVAVLLPMAVEYDVAAIFSGHMHGWEHGEESGVSLIVTGGAGGALDQYCEEPEDFPQPWAHQYIHHRTRVDVTCDALHIEAHDLDDNVIDSFDIPYTGR